jgi:uncharacterized protein
MEKTKRRRRLLGWWSDLMVDHRWLVLLAGLILTVACAVFTSMKLGFQANRNDLISKDLDWNRRFVSWQENFPGSFDLYLAVDAGRPVDGKAPKLAKAKALVDDLAVSLQKASHVKRVVWGFEPGGFSSRAIRMEAYPVFLKRVKQVEDADTLIDSATPGSMLANVQKKMQDDSGADKKAGAQTKPEMTDAEAIAGIRDLRGIVEGFGKALTEPGMTQGQFAHQMEAGSADSEFQYQISRNGRMLFLRITPEFDKTALNPVQATINEVRKVMAEVGARHMDVEFGLTGIEVMESDETAAADRDSTYASIAATIVITIFIALAFHSLRLPIIAMVSLLCGIAWTFGFLTASIGHLQILSVVFVLMLLGMGVDYAVLLSSGYEVTRDKYPDTAEGFKAAMKETLVKMGPGMATGCLTAALAFATTLPTKFTGVAEMGLVSGVGLLLCLLAMFTIYPALLSIFFWHGREVTAFDKRAVNFYSDKIPMFFSRHPRATLAVASVLCILSVGATSQKSFDYDLMKLQPQGVDSIKWQDRIINDSGESIWFGVSITKDLAEARRRADEFRKLPTVAGIRGIGLLFPEKDDLKIAEIKKLEAKLGPSLDKALAAKPEKDSHKGGGGGFLTGLLGGKLDVVGQLKSLRTGMGIYTAMADIPKPILAELKLLEQTIDGVVKKFEALDKDARAAALTRLDGLYEGWRNSRLTQIKQMFDTSPLTPADVPKELLEAYIDKDGRMSLEIVPMLPPDAAARGITGVLDGRFMPVFIADLASVDKEYTGTINQIYQSGFLIKRTYQIAGIIAFFVVLVVLYLDFKSVHDTVCAIFPVAIGFGITFGIMYLTGQQINAANIIVLPLMFGIGVSAGVNILHRYRADPFGRPLGLTDGTGKGVTVTTITSMIGFGAMMFATHRGIASLGFVLCVGLGMTLLASYSVVPAWLELRTRAMEKKGLGTKG